MDNEIQPLSPSYGDDTEAALLSAVHTARENWNVGEPDQKARLRETYRIALRAFSEHLYAKTRA